MNKCELIAEVARLSQRTQKDIRIILNAFFDITAEALKKGEEVDIEHFGKFTAKRKAASYIKKEEGTALQHKRISFEYSSDMKLIIKYNL